MRNGGVDQKTNTIIGLLKALQRRTNAEIKIEEVEEGIITNILSLNFEVCICHSDEQVVLC